MVKLSSEVSLRTDIGTVGQSRAIRALKLGISIGGPGFNIFACGHNGTGRTAAVKAILRGAHPKWSRMLDRCYVHNFKDQDRPRLITLPPRQGKLLKSEMDDLIILLKKNVPLALEQEAFAHKKKKLVEKFQNDERRLFRGFETRLKKKHFCLGQVQEGAIARQELFPVIDGKPYAMAQLEELISSGRLTLDDVRELNEVYTQFQPDLATLFKKRRVLAKDMLRVLSEIEKEAVGPMLDGLIDDIQEKFEDESIHRYLDEVKANLIDDLDLFKDLDEGADDDDVGPSMDDDHFEHHSREREDPFVRYRVNVVMDNSEASSAPIIIETSPTFSNLFGSIEKLERSGMVHADFMGIRAGSLLRADGGFLILNCTDVLAEPHVWTSLKRALRYRKLEIQAPETVYQPVPVALKPEPIPLNLKVVMIGSPDAYQLLSDLDEDFTKIFKIKAEFDSEMLRNRENLDHFFRVVGKIAREEGLKPLSREAMANLAEYAVRRSGRQGKLTTHFSEIADIVREAAYLAAIAGEGEISGRHVNGAIEERQNRSNLLESKVQEMIDEGLLLIDTDGERVGQVNGLWVFELGDFTFGKPTRITCVTSPGKAGVINIEREVSLSGASHDKGVLIIGGYLRRQFACQIPLGLTASLCFEQSYSGVDGDSASLAELICLLSDLSGVPVRQSLAITGSVNQRGEIQAVGAINEKIEGFYRVCKRRGLSGHQGVIIPEANIRDLMLEGEVVEAARQGQFHVFPVRTVDEGIAVATGMPAGARRPDGTFSPDSLNEKARLRLAEMLDVVKDFGGI